jgi:hypothetical protein
VTSILSDPEQVRLIEKWRLRHAFPDAIGMWATATGPEARALAFNAIAQEPKVLQRAARFQAIKLAAQAEDYALSVAGPGTAGNDTWRAVTLFVQRSIDAWRRSLKAYDHRTDGIGVPIVPAVARAHPSDPWEMAQRNFPHVDDETGRLATRILHEFGGDVLQRARKPWDQVIALSVLRHAARRLRGELGDHDSGHASAVADVLAVQSYAEENDLAPMLVGYSGPGKPAAQALSLLRDAGRCATRCARLKRAAKHGHRSGNGQSTFMRSPSSRLTIAFCWICRWMKPMSSPPRQSDRRMRLCNRRT